MYSTDVKGTFIYALPVIQGCNKLIFAVYLYVGS